MYPGLSPSNEATPASREGQFLAPETREQSWVSHVTHRYHTNY
jgi:hypothetical protein